MAERPEQDTEREGGPVRSPYDVLGVPPDASTEEIDRAYGDLARFHSFAPDDQGGADRMDEIRAAYETLVDPARRAEYDAGNAVTAVAVSDDGPTVAEQWAMETPVAPSEELHSRNPLDRLTGRLPRPWRVAIDWIVPIIVAISTLFCKLS